MKKKEEQERKAEEKRKAEEAKVRSFFFTMRSKELGKVGWREHQCVSSRDQECSKCTLRSLKMELPPFLARLLSVRVTEAVANNVLLGRIKRYTSHTVLD